MKRNKRMRVYDTRVWICEGHRPAHDSSPLVGGTILSEHEYWTLQNMITRYYKKCTDRRKAE